MRISLGEWEIRSWAPDDQASLVAYADNPRVWIQLRDAFPHPYTDRDAEEWIRGAVAQDPETHFAIADAREAIGGIGIRLQDDVFRRSAEIGYWVGEPFWGRGIATAAVRALTEYAFRRFDLVRIYAGVFETNPASARVLEKAGYQLEARLRKSVTKAGRTLDELVYSTVR